MSYRNDTQSSKCNGITTSKNWSHQQRYPLKSQTCFIIWRYLKSKDIQSTNESRYAVNEQYAFCKIELANQQTQLLLALSQFKAQLWGPIEVAGRLCFEVLSGNFSGHNGQKRNLDTTQGWSSIMDDLWYKVIWSKFICLLPKGQSCGPAHLEHAPRWWSMPRACCVRSWDAQGGRLLRKRNFRTVPAGMCLEPMCWYMLAQSAQMDYPHCYEKSQRTTWAPYLVNGFRIISHSLLMYLLCVRFSILQTSQFKQMYQGGLSPHDLWVSFKLKPAHLSTSVSILFVCFYDLWSISLHIISYNLMWSSRSVERHTRKRPESVLLTFLHFGKCSRAICRPGNLPRSNPHCI